MAHFAEINSDNNTVIRVLVTEEMTNEEGKKYLSETCGFGGNWVKTSYNTIAGVHVLGGTPLRANYAGIGYTYDPTFDVFIPPQTYPSWKLNYTTYQWQAPIAKPDAVEDHIWKWSEINKEWISIKL